MLVVLEPQVTDEPLSKGSHIVVHDRVRRPELGEGVGLGEVEVPVHVRRQDGEHSGPAVGVHVQLVGQGDGPVVRPVVPLSGPGDEPLAFLRSLIDDLQIADELTDSFFGRFNVADACHRPVLRPDPVTERRSDQSLAARPGGLLAALGRRGVVAHGPEVGVDRRFRCDVRSPGHRLHTSDRSVAPFADGVGFQFHVDVDVEHPGRCQHLALRAVIDEPVAVAVAGQNGRRASQRAGQGDDSPVRSPTHDGVEERHVTVRQVGQVDVVVGERDVRGEPVPPVRRVGIGAVIYPRRQGLTGAGESRYVEMPDHRPVGAETSGAADRAGEPRRLRRPVGNGAFHDRPLVGGPVDRIAQELEGEVQRPQFLAAVHGEGLGARRDQGHHGPGRFFPGDRHSCPAGGSFDFICSNSFFDRASISSSVMSFHGLVVLTTPSGERVCGSVGSSATVGSFVVG